MYGGYLGTDSVSGSLIVCWLSARPGSPPWRADSPSDLACLSEGRAWLSTRKQQSAPHTAHTRELVSYQSPLSKVTLNMTTISKYRRKCYDAIFDVVHFSDAPDASDVLLQVVQHRRMQISPAVVRLHKIHHS